MNKELYEQLFEANKIFSEIKEKENRITIENAKIDFYKNKTEKLTQAVENLKEQLQKELNHIDELNERLGQKNSGNGYIGWAIFDSITGSL